MQNERYTTLESAYERGRQAEGKTIHQLFTDKDSLHIDKSVKTGKKYNKSRMGDAFESWFYKPKDNDSEPDLMPAHVELKATPFKELKTKKHNGSPKYSAKERLVFNMIDYDKLAHEHFDTSHFLYKNKRILMGFYKYNSNHNREKMCKVILYQMLKSNPTDLKIIHHDWDKIRDYVKDGKADKLNERMTDYLAACTKGANGKSRTSQPYSKVPAKTRAFSFKSGYMTTLLRDFILNPHPHNVPASIFHGPASSLHKIPAISKNYKVTNSIFNKPVKSDSIDLDSYILDTINHYKGWTNKRLAKHFGVPFLKKMSKGKGLTDNKGFNYQIISAMFGMDYKHKAKAICSADELQKAYILPKTVQFNYKNKNPQNMSFPAFSFSDFEDEDWHDSKLFNILYDTKFLFCVFKDMKKEKTNRPKSMDSVFMGAILYQFPMKYINDDIKSVWSDTKNKVINGTLRLKATYRKNGKIRVCNNFIKKSDEKIIHVRPHTNNANYEYKGKNTDYLPHGVEWINRPSDHIKYSSNYMTKQCFWINNDFIRKICYKLLK